MYLELKAGNWDAAKFVITKKQKDYDYLGKGSRDVFVYGYPFDDSTAKWISAGNVHQLYSKAGLSFAKDIEGIYTIVILDRERKECSIIVDRYGVYSLFYSKNRDHIILSDAIGEIIARMPEIQLNRESIIEYLAFGFKLGNKTHIVDVHEFEASTIHRIDEALDISEQIYWELLGELVENRIPREDFRKVFNAHVMTATSLARRISLPLSGGLDTRTIISALIGKKDNIHCYTHGVRDAEDVKIAQKICNHFNISHSVYELDEEWIKTIPTTVERNAEMFNGLGTSLSAMHVKRSYEIEDKKGELLISGNMGNEIWRCWKAERIVNSKNMEDLALGIVRSHSVLPSTIKKVFDGYSDIELVKLLKESVRSVFLKARNCKDLIDYYQYFMLRSYCSNVVSHAMKDTGKHFRVFAAFLHRDLLQQLPLMPLDEKTRGSMQEYIIARNDSYLAALPLNSGLAIKSSLTTRIRARLMLVLFYSRAVVNKIYRKLFKANIFTTPLTPATFHDYPAWLRSYHEEFLLDIVDYNRMITKELFDRQALESVVSAFLNGDNSASPFILHLISLEIWLGKISRGKRVVLSGCH